MSNYSTQGFDLDNSGRRIVVDPVTRIEGHLRVEVNLDANNVIRNAVSTGTMWRGLEVILKGRDPRDAWASSNASAVCALAVTPWRRYARWRTRWVSTSRPTPT